MAWSSLGRLEWKKQNTNLNHEKKKKRVRESIIINLAVSFNFGDITSLNTS